MSTAPAVHPGRYSANHLDVGGPARPNLSAVALIISDLLALSTVLGATVGFAYLSGRVPIISECLHLLPLIVLLILLYWLFDVQPVVSLSPVDEIRCVALMSSTGFICLGAIYFVGHSALHFGQLVAVWLLSSGALPAFRSLVRRRGSKYIWWGYPLAVFGAGEILQSVFRRVEQHPENGLRPVAIIDDKAGTVNGRGLDLAEYSSQLIRSGVRHALVVEPKASSSYLTDIVAKQRDIFPYVIVVQGEVSIGNGVFHTRDFGGMPAIEIRNNLLLPGYRLTKRVIDWVLCVLGTVIFTPLLAIISLSIMIESRGPVFYFQKRVGEKGDTFQMCKFRTMVDNASAIFEKILSSSELAKEWEDNRKLRNDPRITRVGRILRKTSLDELPQLWNVIKGEMSLVGPRPLPTADVFKYSQYKSAYGLYVKVLPGMTGLWQVSGRSCTTYAQRVEYDTHYVRNWSIWMDIYLLARTVGVVIRGDGAF